MPRHDKEYGIGVPYVNFMCLSGCLEVVLIMNVLEKGSVPDGTLQAQRRVGVS